MTATMANEALNVFGILRKVEWLIVDTCSESGRGSEVAKKVRVTGYYSGIE